MAPVPERFRVLFWDAKLESLDTEKHRKYIIERLLEYGDEDAYCWMFANYTDEEITEVVRTSRRISPKTAVMMANFYNVPWEEIVCLRSMFPPKP